jgi:hypothetical protein
VLRRTLAEEECPGHRGEGVVARLALVPLHPSLSNPFPRRATLRVIGTYERAPDPQAAPPEKPFGAQQAINTPADLVVERGHQGICEDLLLGVQRRLHDVRVAYRVIRDDLRFEHVEGKVTCPAGS